MCRAPQILGLTLIMLVAGSLAWADQKVLTGVPDYGESAPAALPMGDGNLFGQADYPAGQAKPINQSVALGSSPPEYVWWYGCSLTSGGMLVAYWDAQPGRGGLYNGDASVWSGNGDTGTRAMVASTAHIIAGQENGWTYGDYHNSASYPNHEANPNCIADYMHTVNSGSYSANITSGLKAYAQWNNPGTGKVGYTTSTTNLDVAYWGSPGQAFQYSDMKAEINAGRPVLLNVMTYEPGSGPWVGHSIVAYGYNDNMFQIKVPLPGGSTVNITCGGFAVRDTWANGTGQSDWYDWSYNTVYPTISNGVEWWPFVELQGSSWTGRWDWMVSDAVTMDVVPEPATLSLLVLGGLALIRRRKRVF